MDLLHSSDKNAPKVFCIGRNKTGTTSMSRALTILGYRVAPQGDGQDLIFCWSQRNFMPIIDFCRDYEAFQDAPFSFPYTFQALDAAFPGSRFILTMRRDADAWYDSLIRFHKRHFAGQLPTVRQLKATTYGHTGTAWDSQSLVFNIDEKTLYDRRVYKEQYDLHNAVVLDYFRHRPDDLLTMNLEEGRNWERLCSFLDKPIPSVQFPETNKTR